MKFKKLKKRDMEVEEFDITSLLDILVILLVFLLKSFNDSELTVDLANELALPYSLSRAGAHQGLILQVNKKKNIFLNTIVVGNMDEEGILPKLSDKLGQEYEQRKTKAKPGEKLLLINLLFDKDLQYADINRVLEIASQSGFGKYKLIIQGEE